MKTLNQKHCNTIYEHLISLIVNTPNQYTNILKRIDPSGVYFKNVIQVCGCNQYFMILTKQGNVFSCREENSEIQSSNDNISKHWNVKKIKPVYFQNQPIRFIAMSVNGSVFAISTNNCVYSWGCNSDGQLGLGYDDSDIALYPQMIYSNSDPNHKVIKICAGKYHTLMLKQSGKVFWCGYNGFGNRGSHENISSCNRFTYIDSKEFVNEKVLDISSGIHSMALTESGNIYSWGFGGFGQLGNGDTSSQYSPCKIKMSHFNKEKVLGIGCGQRFSIVITKSKKLQKKIYFFGRKNKNKSVLSPKQIWSSQNKNKKIYNNNDFQDIIIEFQ